MGHLRKQMVVRATKRRRHKGSVNDFDETPLDSPKTIKSCKEEVEFKKFRNKKKSEEECVRRKYIEVKDKNESVTAIKTSPKGVKKSPNFVEKVRDETADKKSEESEN